MKNIEFFIVASVLVIQVQCNTIASNDQTSVRFYLVSRGDLLSFNLIEEGLDIVPGYKIHPDIDKPFPAVVLLHGLGGYLNSTSNILIAQARSSFNIIVADYRKSVEGPDYNEAAKGVDLIGLEVGNFLLKEHEAGNIELDTSTLIGFSLGAHVAGVAGHVIKEASGYLDRIIGLDPAAPWFEDASEEYRLDKSDAGHVIVIHTAGGYLALSEPIGHVDFYPNGGVEPQPLCSGSRLSSIVCSHMASYRYLAESIMRPGFIATKCNSWENFKAGLCAQNSNAFMGFDTGAQVQGKYYLRTNKQPPFGSPLEDSLLFDTEEKTPLPEVFQDVNEIEDSAYDYYSHASKGNTYSHHV